MIFPGTILAEGFITIVALVWSGVCVCPHVGEQVRLAVEFFAAHFTFNFGFSHVALHMDDEILLISQNFVADFTEELLVFPMYVSHV